MPDPIKYVPGGDNPASFSTTYQGEIPPKQRNAGTTVRSTVGADGIPWRHVDSSGPLPSEFLPPGHPEAGSNMVGTQGDTPATIPMRDVAPYRSGNIYSAPGSPRPPGPSGSAGSPGTPKPTAATPAPASAKPTAATSATTYSPGQPSANLRMTSGGTPTPKLPAQKGGFLSDLFGKSYKGTNLWETPIGKSLLPSVSQLGAASPLIGGSLLAAGMGPKDWQTLMSKSGPETARLGGFNRSTLKSFDAKGAKPLAKYGEALYKFGQDLPAVKPTPVQTKPNPADVYGPRTGLSPAPGPQVISGQLPNQPRPPKGAPTPGVVINPDRFKAPYVRLDEQMRGHLTKYLKQVPVEGGYAIDQQTGQPVWVQGGGGGYTNAPLNDPTHPLVNRTYHGLTEAMTQQGYGAPGRGSFGGRPFTREEFANFFAGRRNESQARPAYDAQGKLQTGPMAPGGFYGSKKVPSEKGFQTVGDPLKGVVNPQRTSMRMNVPDMSQDFSVADHYSRQADQWAATYKDRKSSPAARQQALSNLMWLDRQRQKIHGSGRSDVMAAPEDIAKIKTDLLYDNYRNWYKANQSGLSSVPKLRMSPEGSHAATRPFETYLDDVPSLALQLGLLGKMTGRKTLAAETDPYMGSAYHSLMSGGQVGPEHFLERRPEGFGQRAAEFGVDALSLGKNWGNYGLGAHIPGDPRWALSKGLQAPFQIFNPENWAQGARGLKNMPAAVRNIPQAWRAGGGAKQIPAAIKNVAMRPFTSPMKGMGYGSGGGAWNVLRGPTQYSSIVPGMETLSKIPVVGRAVQASGIAKPLTGRAGALLSKTKAGFGTAGRFLGPLEGLRVVLQGPAEEALGLWKAKTPQEREAFQRSRTQGNWSKRFRQHPGLMRPDENEFVDADGDGKWDVDAEGNKVKNPWQGKRSIGGAWGIPRIPVSEGVSKTLGQMLMGMEQPQYAAQELGASILDIPALWGGKGYGTALSDENRNMRFGFDLDAKPLPDFYTEGTHANLAGKLPGVESGIKQFEGQIVPQDDPATEADESRGLQPGTFFPPSDAELEQGVGKEQLVSFMAKEYFADHENPAAIALHAVNNMKHGDRQSHIEQLQRSIMPDGTQRVSDQAVLQHQVRGLLLQEYGDADHMEGEEPWMKSDGQGVALKDLPNEPELHKNGRPKWPDEQGRPLGFRDYQLDRIRRATNQAMRQEVEDKYKSIMAESQNVKDEYGRTGMSPSEATRHALNTVSGQAPTLEHRVFENPNWDTEHPELAYQSVRDNLQSQVTEQSPYRSEAIKQQMLDRHQQTQAGHLQDLRRKRDELAGTEGITGRVEATRDVTEGLKWGNPETMKNVARQQATAEERNKELGRSLKAGVLTPEALAEARKEYNHNAGIIQQAKHIQSVYDAEHSWRGEGDMAELLRKNMSGVGGTIRDYEKYNPRDKNEQILELINSNKGRRALFDTLRKLQDKYETTPAYEDYQAGERSRRGWEAVSDNMR